MKAAFAFAGALSVCVFVFALAFGLCAGAALVLFAQFGPPPPPEEKFVAGLVTLLIAPTVVMWGGCFGAAVGAAYALVPRRARDVWIAMALGAGATLLTPLATGMAAVYPLGEVVVLAAFAALASAIASLIVWKIGV